MKALEKSEKDAIKLRFAVALHKLMEKSEFKSWKRLAKEAGMEPAHIQKIAAGKVDVALTTSIVLSSAFGISYAKLALTFEEIADKDIQQFLDDKQSLRSLKGKSKTRASKKNL